MRQWFSRLTGARKRLFNELGGQEWVGYTNAESELQFRDNLEEALANERDKASHVRCLSPFALSVFKKLGGKKWDVFVKSNSVSEFAETLNKHVELNLMSEEKRQRFKALGGYQWKGFTQTKRAFDFQVALAFECKKTDWPGWIEHLTPKQREMFESLGGINWDGFAASFSEENLRAFIDHEIFLSEGS